MPTLYVENIPDELYEALRTRAKEARKSISAEVIELLSENVPTTKELERRKSLLALAKAIQARPTEPSGPFPSAEQAIREDRDR